MNTIQMLTKLFPKTKNIPEIAKILEKYSNFGINTNLRLAHFLAQVREEVGEEFKVIRENLNYSKESVLKIFKNMTFEEADKYARDEDTPVANQVAISNIAYANKLGNGPKDSNFNGKLDEDDDGWKYRGAGCLQITGKYNFQEVQKRCVKYAGKEFNPDTLEGFIVFGMAYWIQHDLYRLADRGTDLSVVDVITAKINKYTTSYEKRRKHFLAIRHLVGV